MPNIFWMTEKKTLDEFVKSSREALQTLYPAKEAAALAGIVCTDILGVGRYDFLTDPSRILDDTRAAEEAVKRLKNGEPIQYILGKTDFCGREFRVTPSVLIPRPETELLCIGAERIASGKKNPGILDLCTGSGCIAWTLAAEIPLAKVTAVDISEDALEIARSQKITIPNKPDFRKLDVLDAAAVETFLGAMPPFDIIVSNPPYIMECEKGNMRRNVLEHEPAIALFVPDDDPLKFYKAISDICRKHLKGSFIVEINENLPQQTLGVFGCFKNLQVVDDLNCKPRFITGNV